VIFSFNKQQPLQKHNAIFVLKYFIEKK